MIWLSGWFVGSFFSWFIGLVCLLIWFSGLLLGFPFSLFRSLVVWVFRVCWHCFLVRFFVSLVDFLVSLFVSCLLFLLLIRNIILTLQRGVTGTARMLHALTHSSISRQVREQM